MSASSSTRHVAIDLGASGGRVALGVIEDGKLSVQVLHRFPNGGVPVQGGLYWDVIGLWREILHGLRLASQVGPIASVGANSWGVDYALLDEHNLVIDGVHHYRDSRTESAMEGVFQLIPRERLYELTGIQFMPFNTVFQLFAHEKIASGTLAQAKHLLLFPDLLHYWLSGQMASERTIASTSQMYDPVHRDWAPEVFDAVGVPSDLVSNLVDPGTRLGPVSDAVASATGLIGTQVIVPAAHDTASAVAAVPASEGNDWAYISSGTWSLVGVETQKPYMTEDSFQLNLTNEAGIKGTTRLLKNIMGLWILQECRRAWGDPEYPALYEEAEALTESVARIDPDDLRFLHPHDDMPGQVQSYCRETHQTIPTSRAQITRCVLESLAQKCAEVLTQLERVTGNPIKVVHIVGGGSQIKFLNQLIADASGRAVIAGPIEATLMGNLLIQAESYGSIEKGSIRKVVSESESLVVYEPA